MSVELTWCPICGRSGIVRKKTDRIYEVRGHRRVVRGVSVQACPHCGETFIDLEAARKVDRALGLRGARRNASKVAG
jgi:YgiT-type zinc finger domain-containing protein